MKPETIPGFDCLEFKWKVQSDIYERTKNMTVDEQIEFFRHAAETGPFADLVRAVRGGKHQQTTAEMAPPSEKV